MTPENAAVPVLSVRNVHKRFASVTAVDDISFDVHGGEVFALLGPNDAGKTTLLRMLLDLLRPDAGTVRADAIERPCAGATRVAVEEESAKVQFISAVLHRPGFVVLDEPFSGLDPLNHDFFITLIRELRAAGAAVLLSAHQMQLVERVADRILMLNRGQRVLHGSLPDVRRQ